MPGLREVFAGRRGRLLIGLLLAEFAAAVQVVAYAAVLPIASRDLEGERLYGATVAAGSLVTMLVLAVGPALLGRLAPRRALVLATGGYAVGVLAAALAPAMVWVLVGGLLRGAASGLLLGVGLTAIGGLYEDALRPRVLGLFAIMWLLPSFAGPVLTALVAVAAGWRWAMAWPLLLVLAARLLVVRDAGLIPWKPCGQRFAPGNGLAVVAGLTLASSSSSVGGGWSAVSFAAGLAVAVFAGRRVLADLDAEPARRRVVGTFTLLCLAFFGGETLLPLLVVEGLSRGVIASGLALGAGLVAWSLTGLRPPRHADLTPAGVQRTGGPARLGVGLVAVALAALATAVAYGPLVGLLLAVGGFAVAGVGMGLAYPWLTSRAFDDLPMDLTAGVATAVGFAEVSGTALGSLLGGGLYSLAASVDIDPGPAIAVALGMLAVVAVIAVVALRPQVALRPPVAG